MFFVGFENSTDSDSPRDVDFRGVFKFCVAILDQKLEHVRVGDTYIGGIGGVLLTSYRIYSKKENIYKY